MRSVLADFRGIDPSLFTSEIGQVETRVNRFAIAKYHVTNAQYRRFVEAGGYTCQVHWDPDGWAWREHNKITAPRFYSNANWSADSCPVIGLSWYEANAFAHWADARLPTEQEWEWAARGTVGYLYPWGNTFEMGRCNSAEYWMKRAVSDHLDWQTSFFETTPWRERVLTTEVGSFPQGQSAFGVCDMAGNAFEWVQDWFEPDWYSKGPSRPAFGPETGREKVCRGGSFGYPSWCTRTTDRGHHAPDHRSLGLGFRLARDY